MSTSAPSNINRSASVSTTKAERTSSPRHRADNRPGGRNNQGNKKQNVWAKRGNGGTEQRKSSDSHETESITENMTSLSINEKNQPHSNNNGQKKSNNNQVQKVNQNQQLANRQNNKLSLGDFHSLQPDQEAVEQQQESQPEETPTRILWVGNIGNNVSEEDLRREFGKFGKIESIRILHNRFCAFVNFENDDSAKEAKKNLNNSLIGGQYIVIHFRKPEQTVRISSTQNSTSNGILSSDGLTANAVTASSSSSSLSSVNIVLNNPSRALWIGNVSEEVTEDDLKKEFEIHGTIESIRLLRNKTCAFVNFSKVEEASTALHSLQGKKLGSMAIRINFGKPQGSKMGSLEMIPPFIPFYPPMGIDPFHFQMAMPPGMFLAPPGYPIDPYQMYDPIDPYQLYDPTDPYQMYDPAASSNPAPPQAPFMAYPSGPIPAFGSFPPPSPTN